MVEKAQQGFEQLLQALDPQRYPRTRTYIENLMEPVTKAGLLGPITISWAWQPFPSTAPRAKPSCRLPMGLFIAPNTRAGIKWPLQERGSRFTKGVNDSKGDGFRVCTAVLVQDLC
jgi:hypothetical protein